MKLSTGKRINASVTPAGGSATQRIGRLNGEEVGGGENIHVPANELSPGGGFAPLRHRGDSMPAQDVAHGLVGHLIPQIGQRSHNPVVTPAGVLASQANHQILDLSTDARPAGRAALSAAVEFLGYQLAIPGENGIGFGDARDGLQSFATQRLPISASVTRSP